MNPKNLSKLMIAYRLSPNEARVVAYLWERNAASNFELAEVLNKTEKAEEDWDGFANSLKVMIHKIRRKVGKDVIRVVRGYGYEIWPDDKMTDVMK